jgi:hypothetical protein
MEPRNFVSSGTDFCARGIVFAPASRLKAAEFGEPHQRRRSRNVAGLAEVFPMIQDIALRWILTALFILAAAECLFSIAADPRAWTHVVCDALHFIMSVTMAAMAWPWGTKLATIDSMVFFLLAAVWFVVVGFGTGHRVVNGYHALMMLAMAWMYAVMNGNALPGQREARHGTATEPHTSMPGMDMSGADTSPRGGDPPWIDTVNLFCTIGFAVAALWWVYRGIAARKTVMGRPAHRLLGEARQAAMAAGITIMFAVLL